MNTLLIVATLDWGEEEIPLDIVHRRRVTKVVELAIDAALQNPAINPGSPRAIVRVAMGEVLTPEEMMEGIATELQDQLGGDT